jgi:hypothetical protein
LANYIRALAKKVPKYFPESVLNPTFNWTSKKAVAGRFDRRAENMDSLTSPVNNKAKEEKSEKSYLSAAVESISPWGGSRSSTPKPAPANTGPREGSGLKNQHGGDHHTQHWHGLSLKRYPSDCPPLNARWFYAVDVCNKHPISQSLPYNELIFWAIDTQTETQAS